MRGKILFKKVGTVLLQAGQLGMQVKILFHAPGIQLTGIKSLLSTQRTESDSKAGFEGRVCRPSRVQANLKPLPICLQQGGLDKMVFGCYKNKAFQLGL